MKKLMLSIFFPFVPYILFAQLTVNGTVTEVVSEEPLVGVNVFIAGTEIGTSTDANGYYRLSVPLNVGNKAEITVCHIGYKTKSVTVPVSDTQITQNFELSVDPLKLCALVVTGVAGELTKTKTPFTIDRIGSDILELVPSTSLDEIIRGKAAGVKVVKGSGIPGSTSSIQLRGATTINSSGRSQAPLFIIDDIIIDPSVSGNPFSDISPDDIESIEIVKGAAGSSMYGARAANGIITIKTKRGTDIGLNQTKYYFKTEFGKNSLINKIKMNKSHWYKIAESSHTDTNGVAVTSGDFVDAHGEFIDPREKDKYEEPYSDSTWASDIFFSDKPYKYVSTGKVGDPLVKLPGNGFDNFNRFFKPGGYKKTTFSLKRNTEKYNLYVALSNHQENGLFDFLRGFERNSLRINSDIKLPYNLKIGLTNFISKSNQDEIDEFTPSPFHDILFFDPSVDLEAREDDGTYIIAPDPTDPEADNPIYQVREASFFDDRSRILTGLTLIWALTPQFRFNGSLSYDRSNRLYRSYYPKGYKTAIPSPTINEGSLTKSNSYEEILNVVFGTSYGRKFGDLNFIGRLRYTYEDDYYDYTSVKGWDFIVVDVPQLNIANEQSISSSNSRVKAEGFSLGTQLDYNDKYILDVSFRRDGSSLFGEDERWANYYRISGAYRISKEPFWPLKSFINEFKLRASRGTAGVRPPFSAQYETWTVMRGIVSKGVLGNKKLMPQHSTESELGLDMALIDRVFIELTYAKTINERQILFMPLAGYYGYSHQWKNAGTLEATALEASINAVLLSSRDMKLFVDCNYDKITQKITEFKLPSYLYAPPKTAAMKVFYMRANEDYGAIYGSKWITSINELPEGNDVSLFDINDDGYVVYVGSGNTWKDGISKELWGRTSSDLGDELSSTYSWGMPIKYVDADGETTHKIGSIIPDFSYSFTLNFQYKQFAAYALFDGQVGGHIYNMTKQWGVRGARMSVGEVDQQDKSDDEKKPTVYYRNLYDDNNPNSHYVEGGDYLKLRELSVRYTLGNCSHLGFKKITVGLVARNLFTWTDYSGYDPEVGISGGETGSAVNARFDSFVYPNYKTISGVLGIEF